MRKAESDAALTQMLKSQADFDPYDFAQVYAFRGESAQALEWLDRAYAQKDAFLKKGAPRFVSQSVLLRYFAVLAGAVLLRSRPVEVFRPICGSLGKILSIVQRTAVALARWFNLLRRFSRVQQRRLDYPVRRFPALLRSWAGEECLMPPGRPSAREGRAG